MIKSFFAVSVVLILSGCSVDADKARYNKPNSGVIPQEIERTGDGKLVHDTEKLPMTGQWCKELDVEYRRPGNNCLADY